MSNASQERCCPTRHSFPCVIPKLERAKNGSKGMLVQQRMEMMLSKFRQHLKIKSPVFGHVLVI